MVFKIKLSQQNAETRQPCLVMKKEDQESSFQAQLS